MIKVTTTSAALFATRLEAFIKKHQSIADAAAALGVTRSAIYQWRQACPQSLIPNKPEVLQALGLALKLWAPRSPRKG